MSDAPRAGPPQKRERGPGGTGTAYLENGSDYQAHITTSDQDAAAPSLIEQHRVADVINAVRVGAWPASPEKVGATDALQPVEYFEIHNPTIDRSVKQAKTIDRDAALEAASDRYEKLVEHLAWMGCIATTTIEGTFNNIAWCIYGGIYARGIASSRSEWVLNMENLLPPEEGWVFQPAFVSGVEGAKGRFGSRRNQIKSELLRLPGAAQFGDVDR